MPELKIVLGPGAPRAVELPEEGERWVLGTASSCEVVLEDGSVRERHAVIRRRGPGYVIEPAEAGAPIELNGEPAETSIPLQDADVILLGQTTLEWLPGDAIDMVAMGPSLEDSISTDGLVVAPGGLVSPRPYTGIELTADLGAGFHHDDDGVITGDHLMDAVTQVVQAVRGGSAVPETALASLTMAFGADRALLFLPFGGERPRLVASFLGPAELSPQEGITQDLLAKVKDAGIPVVVNASTASVQLPNQPSVGGAGSLRSLMAVPVPTASGEGTLVLDGPLERKRFQEDDQAVLASFATTLSYLLSSQSRIQRMEELIEDWSRAQARWLRDAPDVPRPLREAVEAAAPGDDPVLLVGEPGSGKRAGAQWLHHLSVRAAEPLVTVDCARGDDLLEVLFGSAAGPPSALESADRGTLLLEHVTALPLAAQSRLEGYLSTGVFEPEGVSETRPSRARLVFTSEQDPAAEGGGGWFRSSLLERIPEESRIPVPALREDPERLRRVAERHLAHAARRFRSKVRGFSAGALEELRAHDWPGNHRELVAVLDAAVLREEGEEIAAETLQALLPRR